MQTDIAQKDQARTAGHLRRFFQEVADFLHIRSCEFQRVFVYLSPSGEIGPLNLAPRLEGRLRRIRQRQQVAKTSPIDKYRARSLSGV